MGFLRGFDRKKVKRSEKLLKKGRQKVLDGNFMEVGVRPKKGRQIFWPPPFLNF
jgi:hypothetical protein